MSHYKFVLAAAFVGLSSAAAQTSKSSVQVTIQQDKEERLDADAPVDPTPRVNLRQLGTTFSLLLMNDKNQRLHLSHFPTFKIDGAVQQAGITPDGRIEIRKEGLPKKGGKDRSGYANVWTRGDLHITQTVELVPSKNIGEDKRRQTDAVLVRYLIENKGKAAHSVGMRTCIDSWLIDVRNCKFAAPTRPGKLLDGVEFKEREVPPYVQVLQKPDLKNPGAIAYLTFPAGSAEKPQRLVLTGTQGRRDLWDLPVMAGGLNSAMGFFWEPKEIRPGGKRELTYAYGLGLATPLAADTQFQIDLSGSFEPGKFFTITARVQDPSEGQSLQLELPKGLAAIEGKAIQPIPQPVGEAAASLVLWKGRVLEYGRFPIRVRSSTGVARTTIVTIAPGKDG